ncbi:MAG: hypothetical protein LBK53_08330 [Heliobacteriaceae bacterium]|jgi:hypothetical protein|nr:hypothetical protein [Heliobacteriaceae bacterium]
MSYKYDSYLVIANKFSSAESDAKAQLWETYDKLRDLTVSGSGQGTGFEMASGFLYNLASLFSPSMYGTIFGASESMSVPGTSYYNRFNGGSSYGLNSLYNYSGFPGGAAPVSWGLSGVSTGGAAGLMGGWGTDDGYATGFASNIGGLADIASAAAWGLGGGTGYGWAGKNIVMPLAGIISGWGGIMQAAAPYLGEYGLPAMVMANLMQGTSSAALAAYQNITGNITASADTILSNKVRNIETVCKMLSTQGDIVKKMLKEDIEGDSKSIQNL